MKNRRIKVINQTAVYHCMSRVVGGQALLDDRAKEVLRKQLWQVADFCGVQILTYCILSNHFHVLVRVPEKQNLSDKELLRRARKLYRRDKAKTQAIADSLKINDAHAQLMRRQLQARMGDVSNFIKELKQRLSIWYNQTHQRYGTLWAECFKSTLIENKPEALRTVAAYIDLNAVRAGLCKDPLDYRYCGYAEAMGASRPARQGLSHIIGSKKWPHTAKTYRMILFGKGYKPKATGQPSLDPAKVKATLAQGGKLTLPEALRCRVRYFTDGAVLGSKEFVQTYFEAHREHFGKSRKTGPRPMTGSDWQNLTVLRNLQTKVIS